MKKSVYMNNKDGKKIDGLKSKKVSDLTLARLGQYLHFLDSLDRVENDNVSSNQIGSGLGLKPSQVRKDLSFFGEFGKKSKGYDIVNLIGSLKDILGLNRHYMVGLVGVGNLGSALLNLKSLSDNGFKVVAIFDSDERKIGMVHYGHRIYDVREFTRIVSANSIEIGIITTTSQAAQQTADLMCEAGIRGIINFTTKRIVVPDSIFLQQVDMTLEFFVLSHYLSSK